jgi:hypothetical protein
LLNRNLLFNFTRGRNRPLRHLQSISNGIM